MVTISPPAPASHSPARGSILGDYVRGLMPDELLRTIWHWVRDHRQFFDELFRDEWQGKTRPIPFFLTCFTAFLFAGQFAPGMEPTWVDAWGTLEESDQAAVVQSLGFMDAPYIDWTSDETATAGMEQHLRGLLGVGTGPVTADHLVQALASAGNEALSLRIENHFLRAEKEEGKFEGLGLHLALLLYFIPLWWLTHRFLGVTHRTARDTVYVYMYTFGMLLLLVGVPGLFLGQDGGPAWLALWVVAASFYLFVKSLRIFRHTHDVGFWQLTKASFKVNLVIVGLFIAAALVVAAFGAVA